MKTKILAFLLAIITVLTFVSCGDDNKKKESENALDLSKYVVAKNDKITVDAAIYAFFLYDYVGQYSYYLSWYGYDTTKPLTEQTSKCAFDETKTWFEYFDEMTRTTVSQCIAFASAAMEAGMSLSDEDKADLDEYMKQTEEEAFKQGYDGIEGLIANYYVKGITEESFRACMELQQLAYMYVEKLLEEIDNVDYDTTTLEKFVSEHKDEFYGIDYVHYTFFPVYDKDATDEEKKAAYADAKKRAEDFLKANTDIESIKNAIVEIENEGEEEPYDPEVILADYIETHELPASDDGNENDKAYREWAFSPDRKAGDTYIREHEYSDSDVYYSVNCIIKPAYVEDTVTKTARHIFFEVNSKLTGDELEAAAKAAYDKAQEVYETSKNGEMTSEAFAALAKEHSQDSNKDEGGIYENIGIGDMVSEFEDWIYDPARKHGDTDIIKTEYGYHIMFFEQDGLKVWESQALDAYKDELYTKASDELVAKYPLTFDSEAIKNIP